MKRLVMATLLVGFSVAWTQPIRAQALRGVVVSAADSSAIPGALVRLVDGDGRDKAVALADSMGRYHLSVPEPGEYRLAAARFGYHTFESPLLSITGDRIYPVDIELAVAPVGIPGLVVSAKRFAELERGVQLAIGVSSGALRNDLIFRPQIDEHLARGHDVVDVVRWSNFSSIVTKETRDGPCFQWRNRHCLPVYLNGVPVVPELVHALPLDMVETMVVLAPGESLAYNSGGVLLYTAAWIR